MKKVILFLTAVVTAIPVFAQDIIINEINYNSAALFDTEDWVEFYNNTSTDIDLAGWAFKDGDDADFFIFPPGTIIEAEGYIVAVRDTVDFTTFFPNVTNFVGEVEFRLSNGGEHIRLFDDSNAIVDSLTYDDAAPWPTEPDGNGPTLELIDPSLPNHYPASWRASLNDHGSPGGENVYTSVEWRPEGQLPDGFRLNQNYPNPFNASTAISYQLLAVSNVNLTVYDITGHEVAALVNGFEAAGAHSIIWNAEGFTSGVYFVRLNADGFEQTQKMLLVK